MILPVKAYSEIEYIFIICLSLAIIMSLRVRSIIALFQGKPVWSLEDKQVSCVAGNDLSVAVGDGTGLVTVYSVSDWSELAKYAPTSQDRTVMLVEFITVTIKKKRYNCLLVRFIKTSIEYWTGFYAGFFNQGGRVSEYGCVALSKYGWAKEADVLLLNKGQSL